MPRSHRTSFSIQHVYIADGFADDCDDLIHRCSRVDILSYQTFCIYYKEMNFASLYQGRTSNAEIAELSEEVIHIAKYYMVLDTSNFEESVAGLFLVYTLLNLQPYPRFASLRLVPEDLPALARIQQVARRTRRLDVLYVLGSVLTRGPVQFHAAARPRGMESSLRKYLESFCNIDITGVRPKGVYFRQNEELDIIRDMAGIFKKYSQAKGQIPGLEKRVLSYSNDNLAVELGASLKRLINGIVEEEGGDTMQHHTAVQEIKKRAMKNVVSTVRHLDSAGQRSPEKKIQQKDSPPASGSKSNETQTKITPKQRAIKKSTLRKRAQKRKKNSSSSENEEYTENEAQNDTDDWCIASYGNLGEIDKKDQEIYVEIDALPSFITTESNGKLVEIEIIDEMKRDDNTKERSKGGCTTDNTKERSKGGNTADDTKERSKGGNTADNTKGRSMGGNTTDNTKGRSMGGNITDNTKGRSMGRNTSDNTKGRSMGGNTSDNTKEMSKGGTTDNTKVGSSKGESNTDKPKEKKRGRPKKDETKSDDEIFKRPLRVSPRLKTIQKRDMKKVLVKSKFKKMGMLPVANFEEQT